MTGRSQDDLPPAPGDRRRWWRTPLRVGAVVATAVVVVVLLRDKLPSPAQIADALTSAHPGWVVAAVALQLLSTGTFARQQHRLLSAFGVRLSVLRVGAITYSSTAIANSVPAGAAVSAGWSLRQFRARGASGATAVTVTLLSGVLSIVGLLLLAAANLVVVSWTRLSAAITDHLAVTLSVVAAVALLVGWLVRRWQRPPGPGTPRLDQYQSTHPRLGAAARQALTTIEQARRVGWTDWLLALALASAKWVLDAASLYAACRAFDIDIGTLQLAALYLGIQLLRQIPLTPGGLGVIEVALLAGLVALGAPDAAATATVLLYRLVSAWLMIPLGYVAMAGLTGWDRRHAVRPATPAAESLVTEF